MQLSNRPQQVDAGTLIEIGQKRWPIPYKKIINHNIIRGLYTRSSPMVPSAKNIHTRIHSQVICAIGLYMIIYICPVCRDTIFSRSLLLQSLFLSLFFGWLVGC